MLAAWCKENYTKDWTAGLHSVNLAKYSRPRLKLTKKC